MSEHVRHTALVWATSTTAAIVLVATLVACGGGSGSRSGTPARPEDLVMQPADFRNIHTMTKVRGFFVDNRLGHRAEALKVANSPTGGVYPVGTILQLVPQEAMVKRHKGLNRATRDWEFFFLSTTPAGTEIKVRGVQDVVNRFGGNCASCHAAAAPQWDSVCEHDHGCAPLPIGDNVIAVVQQADPRPRS